LCYAPGITESGRVNFFMDLDGFRLGGNRNSMVLVDASGTPINSSRLSTGLVGGPVAKMEFFIEETGIGERIADPTQTNGITGYMANANFRGGAGNRHRHGTGRYFLANRTAVEQIGRLLGDSSMIPKPVEVDRGEELMEVIDAVRGSGSDISSWFTWALAAMRSGRNQVYIAWLIFPERPKVLARR
jgi:hypothetical protein